MTWEPSAGSLAEKESRVVARVSVAQDESESGYARNATRQVSAMRSIAMTTKYILDEVDDLANRLVAAVNVASNDKDGDGLAGHQDPDLFPMDDEARQTHAVFALSTSQQRLVLTPEVLARRWAIGLDTAKRTLQVTTQAGIRNVLAPGERKLRQRLDHLKFPNFWGRFYTNTMFSKVTSIRGHRTAQIFTNGQGYDQFYRMESKSGPPTLMTNRGTIVRDRTHGTHTSQLSCV